MDIQQNGDSGYNHKLKYYQINSSKKKNRTRSQTVFILILPSVWMSKPTLEVNFWRSLEIFPETTFWPPLSTPTRLRSLIGQFLTWPTKFPGKMDEFWSRKRPHHRPHVIVRSAGKLTVLCLANALLQMFATGARLWGKTTISVKTMQARQRTK